jgi:hypothetical protein
VKQYSPFKKGLITEPDIKYSRENPQVTQADTKGGAKKAPKVFAKVASKAKKVGKKK